MAFVCDTNSEGIERALSSCVSVVSDPGVSKLTCQNYVKVL